MSSNQTRIGMMRMRRRVEMALTKMKPQFRSPLQNTIPNPRICCTRDDTDGAFEATELQSSLLKGHGFAVGNNRTLRRKMWREKSWGYGSNPFYAT